MQITKPVTAGINHLGLAVADLQATTNFFVNCLKWQESGADPSYPRTAVTDGVVRLTLWQVDRDLDVVQFDRCKNIGLHHLALEVESEQLLDEIAHRVAGWPLVQIEFPPESVGNGPRKHMMCLEPGGIRVEFIWRGI